MFEQVFVMKAAIKFFSPALKYCRLPWKTFMIPLFRISRRHHATVHDKGDVTTKHKK